MGNTEFYSSSSAQLGSSNLRFVFVPCLDSNRLRLSLLSPPSKNSWTIALSVLNAITRDLTPLLSCTLTVLNPYTPSCRELPLYPQAKTRAAIPSPTPHTPLYVR